MAERPSTATGPTTPLVGLVLLIAVLIGPVTIIGLAVWLAIAVLAR